MPWRRCPDAPPPPRTGWLGQRCAGRSLEGALGGGGGRALGGRRPKGWGRRRPVKVTDSRERWPGGPSSGSHAPAGWQTAPGQWRQPVMSRRSPRKLLFTSGSKLLTLGQILWHYADRAFHELPYVCFGFILAIMGIALDRSKWASVISLQIAIMFEFDPIWPRKYWPKVTKIAHLNCSLACLFAYQVWWF